MDRQYKYKHFLAFLNGEKIPRKAKKSLLGKRLNKQKIGKILSNLQVLEVAKTMYDRPVFNVPWICPKCGCERRRTTGNMTSYPEHWENIYCLRCNHLIAFIDNSPYIHCFEYKEQNFII